MDPISWILGGLLLISGGANWWQAEVIDNKAKEVKKVSTELQKANDDIKARDAKLIQAEVNYTASRRRFGDALQQQGFYPYPSQRP